MWKLYTFFNEGFSNPYFLGHPVFVSEPVQLLTVVMWFAPVVVLHEKIPWWSNLWIFLFRCIENAFSLEIPHDRTIHSYILMLYVINWRWERPQNFIFQFNKGSVIGIWDVNTWVYIMLSLLLISFNFGRLRLEHNMKPGTYFRSAIPIASPLEIWL